MFLNLVYNTFIVMLYLKLAKYGYKNNSNLLYIKIKYLCNFSAICIKKSDKLGIESHQQLIVILDLLQLKMSLSNHINVIRLTEIIEDTIKYIKTLLKN